MMFETTVHWLARRPKFLNVSTLFSALVQFFQTIWHRVVTSRSSWVGKMASSNEYQEVGGRQNPEIGCKLALRFVNGFSRTESSETTLDGQARPPPLEVCCSPAVKANKLLIVFRFDTIIALCGSQERSSLPSVKDVARAHRIRGKQRVQVLRRPQTNVV